MCSALRRLLGEFICYPEARSSWLNFYFRAREKQKLVYFRAKLRTDPRHMPLEKALCFNRPFLGKGTRQEKQPLEFYFQLLMTVTNATEQSLPLVKVRVRWPKGFSQKETFPGWVLLIDGALSREGSQGE